MEISRREQQAPPRGLLLVLCLAAFAWALAQTTLIPAFPALERDLHCGPSEVAWTMTGYLIPAAVMTPTLGRLGDLLGRRRVLLWTLVVFAAGCAISALGDSLPVVVLGRVLQGAGGGIFPLCFGIIREEQKGEAVSRSIGTISALVGAGGGLGLFLGGLIVDNASIHWIFWVTAIIAAVAFVAVFLVVPESRERAPGGVDLRGAVLLGFGLALPLFAISRANVWGWLSPATLGLAAVGFLVLLVFVRIERRTEHPLADVAALARRPVLMTNLATLLIGFGIFGSFILTPQLAQAPTSSGYGLGLDATGGGLVMVPGALAMLFLGPFSGALGSRIGNKFPLILGAAVAALGLVLLAFVHDSVWALVGFAGMLYAGVGLCFAAMPNLIVEAVPPVQTGEMTGFNALVRTTGSSLGTQVSSAILAGTAAASVPSEGSYELAFLISAAAAAGAILIGIAIPTSGRRTKSTVAEEIGAAGPVAEPAYAREQF
jgi:EmrB/QacA subfamily drug resistance transporter